MILLVGNMGRIKSAHRHLINAASHLVSQVTIGRPANVKQMQREREAKIAQEEEQLARKKAEKIAQEEEQTLAVKAAGKQRAKEAAAIAQRKIGDAEKRKQREEATAKKEADAIKAKKTEADEQNERKKVIKAKIDTISKLQPTKPKKPLLPNPNSKDSSNDLANFKQTIDDHQEAFSSTDVIHYLFALNEKVASIPAKNLTRPMIDNYEKSITTLLEKHENSTLTKATNTKLHEANEDDIKNVINDYRIAEVKETMGLQQKESANDIKKQLQKILYALPHDAKKQIELITAFNKQEKQKNTNPTWITARKTVANWVKTNKKWTAALVATVVVVIGIALNSALSDGEDDEGEE